MFLRQVIFIPPTYRNYSVNLRLWSWSWGCDVGNEAFATSHPRTFRHVLAGKNLCIFSHFKAAMAFFRSFLHFYNLLLMIFLHPSPGFNPIKTYRVLVIPSWNGGAKGSRNTKVLFQYDAITNIKSPTLSLAPRSQSETLFTFRILSLCHAMWTRLNQPCMTKLPKHPRHVRQDGYNPSGRVNRS